MHFPTEKVGNRSSCIDFCFLNDGRSFQHKNCLQVVIQNGKEESRVMRQMREDLKCGVSVLVTDSKHT